jgi:hypothetical protein
MPRKAQAKLTYSQDMAGMWLYLRTPDGSMILLTDRPIVDPVRQKAVIDHCSNAKPDLELVTR